MYASLKAEGDGSLLEREIFRKRSAAVVHGLEPEMLHLGYFVTKIRKI